MKSHGKTFLKYAKAFWGEEDLEKLIKEVNKIVTLCSFFVVIVMFVLFK